MTNINDKPETSSGSSNSNITSKHKFPWIEYIAVVIMWNFITFIHASILHDDVKYMILNNFQISAVGSYLIILHIHLFRRVS